MTTYEIFENHYKDFAEYSCSSTKYEWAACEVFGLITYDGSLDELFVKKIVEVCKAILDKQTYEFQKVSDENEIQYIIVCQLLNGFNWLNWGLSIRGAWFDSYHPGCKSKPILDRNLKDYGVDEIRFTIENLKTLIDFIEH